MKSHYDIVFVTHLPAFYKVNLYNALAKKLNIYVIFIGQSSQIRAGDFVALNCQFDHCILDLHHFENRSRWRNSWQIVQFIKKLNYCQLVVGGWDLPEFWALVFSSPKIKNALALESSIYESNSIGWRANIKKLFLSRISTVYSSGIPHQQLLQALKFQGQIKKTLGVGIFNYQGKLQGSERLFQGKFITVARLAPEKNLKLVMDVFTTLPEFQLTIIGQGPQYESLQAICPDNVNLLGYVPNAQLAEFYQAHDIFILPSTAEPWGLVVEEALYFGLPVLASKQVGCAPDLIEQLQTGLLFDPLSADSLRQAIFTAQAQCAQLAVNVKNMDFTIRDQHQVQQYLECAG